MRKLVLIAFTGLVIVAAAVAWLAADYRHYSERPLNPDGPVNLWVAPGTSFAGLGRELERLGLIAHDWRWRLVGRIHAPTVKAGEYRIEAGTSLAGLIDQLERGAVRNHRFTIVEGWTLSRLRSELADDPRLVGISAGLDEDRLMEQLGCAGCIAEGYFLPETYFFTRGTTDLALLQRSHEAMRTTLEKVWEARADDLPIDSPEALLTLASIIERETGQASERARVAGVFVRRLELGMRLQTDPTVIYGLGEDFDGRLRRVHLRSDHPWNTYTRHGLPATPIALPGRASLEAAARPAGGTALYFVSRGDGTHHFSDTLQEHNAAVDRYIRGRR